MVQPLRPADPGRFGRYRLLGRLGAGGMGVVYLGRSPEGRAVAVKVIRPRFAEDPEFRARFRRELAAADRVTGTFTAAVLDADPTAPSPWLVTVYLPGMSLREAVGAFGALPPAAVRSLAAGLAEALVAVHRAGVVHRDVKPENVMLTAGGPRLIDFGIARPEDATAITALGETIGSPRYMSPEQFGAGPVGPATDVWSLGLVLSYATTGTDPRHGTEPVGAAATGPEPPDGVDPALAGPLADCLCRDPHRRPTAGSLLDRVSVPDGDTSLLGTGWLPPPVAAGIGARAAIVRALLHRDPADPDAAPFPAVAPDPGPGSLSQVATLDGEATLGGPAPRGPSRRALLALGGVAAAAVVGGAAAAVWLRQRPAGAAHPTAPRPASTGRPLPSPTTRWRVPLGDEGPDVLLAGGLVLAKANQTVHALEPRTGRTVWSRSALHWSVAGDLLYLLDTESFPWSLHAVRPDTGTVVWTHGTQVFPDNGPVPMGGSAVCFGGDGFEAVRVADGGTVWTSSDQKGKHGLAGDAAVAVSAGDTGLVAMDAGTGAVRWSYPMRQPVDPVTAGGIVFASDLDSVLHAIRTDTGRPAWQTPGRTTGGFEICYADGLLYLNGFYETVLVLRADTGARVWARSLGHGDGGDYGYRNQLGRTADTLYISGTDDMLYALDPMTGQPQWLHPLAVTLTSPAAATAGLVFAGSRDGYLNALDPPGGGRHVNS